MIFASLWDSKYHRKGMALLQSLACHQPDAFVYVLALDDHVYKDLLGRPHVHAIHLDDFEGPRLKDIRGQRTWQEYCWTLGSVFTYWALVYFDCDEIAYLDADCYLFGSLDPLYASLRDHPLAIIPHRWTPAHADRLRPNGMFNVSWVWFGPSPLAHLVARTWRDQCLDWCYYRIENGKMADQGYLEHWPEHYDAHVVPDLGVGLAPWNQEQYAYAWEGDRLWVTDGVRRDPVTLYHFHGYHSPKDRCGYPLHPKVAQYLYRPYERTLEAL